MKRLRSRLNPRLVVALSLLVLGGSLLAFATASPSTSLQSTELGTTEQQAKVRTSRDVSGLPLRSYCTVVPEKELFITDVSVVDDCWRTTWNGICLSRPVAPATRGAWTVGKLLEGIFGTTDPATLSNLTLRWLRHWSVDQTINSDLVPARPSVEGLIIKPWLAASGSKILDMKKAPFRLLAIVARLDLRQNSGYSSGTTAGEGRFVFDLLDAEGNPTNFLLILEYGLDAADCNAVLNWANAWHSLSAYPFGPDYNAALQSVTDRFTSIGASPGKPNGSAINQVRTNDFFLDIPWELREFKLNALVDMFPAPLDEVTVAQTPARSLQETSPIATFVNANEPAVLAHQHVVPLIWSGSPFRGGASPHSLELGWDGPPLACTSITNPEARHAFSLDTCSGCHGQETATFFKHVDFRFPGSPSNLSTFLTGTGGPVTDRCGRDHTFGDIERRRVDLCQLLEKSCSQIDSEPVITFAH